MKNARQCVTPPRLERTETGSVSLASPCTPTAILRVPSLRCLPGTLTHRETNTVLFLVQAATLADTSSTGVYIYTACTYEAATHTSVQRKSYAADMPLSKHCLWAARREAAPAAE